MIGKCLYDNLLLQTFFFISITFPCVADFRINMKKMKLYDRDDVEFGLVLR